MTVNLKERQQKLSKLEESVAQDLYQAYHSKQPLQMVQYTEALTDEAASYRVQQRVTELKGEEFGGYKVSLTSQQTQDMFDSDEPLYGAQVASHFVKSGATLEMKSDLMAPLAEVELVFKAKEALSPEDSLAELAAKTTVAPGVEVPDSRFADWFPALSKYLVMADSAVGGYVVYGKELETSTLSMSQLSNVNCQLFYNNREVARGNSAEVLGNPLNALKWLVNKLDQQGKTLSEGEQVSSGTFLLPVDVKPGEWRVTFDNYFEDVHFSVKAMSK
ncbi:2-keto-4-pentenoate hydratase [Holzapfeliella sp. JNUCC 80]